MAAGESASEVGETRAERAERAETKRLRGRSMISGRGPYCWINASAAELIMVISTTVSAAERRGRTMRDLAEMSRFCMMGLEGRWLGGGGQGICWAGWPDFGRGLEQNLMLLRLPG